MEITVVINDDILHDPVMKAVSVAVNTVVREVVNRKIDGYRNQIGHAVELYLAKKMTDVQVQNEIDKAIAAVVREKIEDLR